MQQSMSLVYFLPPSLILKWNPFHFLGVFNVCTLFFHLYPNPVLILDLHVNTLNAQYFVQSSAYNHMF